MTHRPGTLRDTLAHLFSPNRKANGFMFAFWLFFILGLTSGYWWAIYAGDGFAMRTAPLLAAFAAMVFAVPAWLLGRLGWRVALCCYAVAVSVLMVLLTATDLFLWLNFHRVINQDVVDIMADTNASESAQFLSTYMPFGTVAAYIAGGVALIALAWVIAVFLARLRPLRWIAVALALGGLAVWGYCAYNFAIYRNGHSIPQYTTLTRTLHSLHMLQTRLGQIESAERLCAEFIASPPARSVNDSLVVCLIIGESHSAFHTPAYGYDKNTFPKLGRLAEEPDSGTMTWFTDIVTIDDHTHNAMKSIFSMGMREEFGGTLLFPAVFKGIGYETTLLDNQYTVGSGISFLGSRTLSELLYDRRNNATTTDAALADSLSFGNGNCLAILHIMGSHYTYAERYPHREFGQFGPADYPDNPNPEQRAFLAHYDNSLLYTDQILHSLLTRLMNRDAVVLYVSDHGEELFEHGTFMGHGNAASLPEPDYQIRVPMMVWSSPRYNALRPDKASQIAEAAHRPGMSDDVSHLLLDLAGENTVLFDSARSIIRPTYTPPRRTVLHSIDFDKVSTTSLTNRSDEE